MKKHQITEIRHLSDNAYVLRFERNDLAFQTGQFIMVGPENSKEQREYSIYSGENDNFLEILVREVDGGRLSKKLKHTNPGDFLHVDGPFGFFKFKPQGFSSGKFLFVATGTGISPFHSFVRTYPGLDYRLVHGVRYASEAYEHNDFETDRITLCTTGDQNGRFFGRVTDYLASQRIDRDTHCFLCGNSEMIHEVFDILTAKGISVSNIFSEVYF